MKYIFIVMALFLAQNSNADEINEKQYSQLRALFYNSSINTSPSYDELESKVWYCETFYSAKPGFSNPLNPGLQPRYQFQSENKKNLAPGLGFGIRIGDEIIKLEHVTANVLSGSAGRNFYTTDRFGAISGVDSFYDTLSVIRKVGDYLIVEESVGSRNQFFKSYQGQTSLFDSSKKAASYSRCQ